MGFTTAADGSLTFQATPTQTVADMQAITDRTERIGGLLDGTSQDRLNLTNGQAKDGWLFFETDTGIGYVRRGGSWVPAFGHSPEASLIPVGNPVLVNGQANVHNWAAVGAGSSVTQGWFSYDTNTGDLKFLKSGRYTVTARTVVSASSSDQSLVAYMVRNGAANDILAQDTVRTHPTYATMIRLDIGAISVSANESMRVFIAATSGEVYVGGGGRSSGEFSVQYVGAIT